MATNRPRYKTWGRSRSVRLPGFDYHEHAAYHVTICAKKGTEPFTDERLAAMGCETVRRVCDQCDAYVGAYCLMPDHLHLLISPDQGGMALGDIVGRIKGATTNRSWRLGWNGTLWQARFHDHIVRRNESVAATARYIFENPARKGLSLDYAHRFVDPNLP